MIEEFLDESLIHLLINPIVWAIFALAIFLYAILINLCFLTPKSSRWYSDTLGWEESLGTLISALPLLGLLGTISGLLATFFQMSLDNGFHIGELISGGIADAMFTTQLGLLLAIPAWLLLARLKNRLDRWTLKVLKEATCDPQ